MSADTTQKDPVGTWRLVSSHLRTLDGQVTYPWGPDAVGYYIFSESGHSSVAWMAANRRKFAADDVMGGMMTPHTVPVPLGRLERPHTAPEAAALSTELQGLVRLVYHIRASLAIQTRPKSTTKAPRHNGRSKCGPLCLGALVVSGRGIADELARHVNPRMRR